MSFMQKIKNSIIIIFYKKFEHLDSFLKCIYQKDKNENEIIIIDNNGEDIDQLYLNQKFKNIRYYKLSENLGFGYACNLAAKIALGDNLLFINYDSKLQRNTLNDFFNEYYKKVKQNKLLVNVKSKNLGGNLTHEGKYLTIDFLGFPALTNNQNRNFYCEGSFLYLSKKNFNYLGGFDNKFFMYVEDIDLSWRAHLYGFKIKSIDKYDFIHISGGSSEDKNIFNNNKRLVVSLLRRNSVEKSTLRMVLKNYSFYTLILILPFYIAMSLIEILFFLAIGQLNYSKIIFFSYIWNLINFKSTLKLRKIIQKKRINNDIYVLKKSKYFPNKINDFLLKGLPKFY